MINERPGADGINQRNQLQYNDYYNKPAWWFKFRYDTQIKRKTCLHLVRKAGKSFSSQRILEIGFGSGETIFSFAKNCALFGIEISESAISNARKRASRSGFLSANFLRSNEDGTLPFPSKDFDIVIASHVIEHVEDDVKLLAECHRVIKQDGIVVLLIPINEKYIDPNHIHRYSVENFFSIVHQVGFQVLFSFQNELLFHLVERFYHEGYIDRRKITGPLIAALFNFTFSVLPFTVYIWIEKILGRLGFLPRQAGFVLTR